MTATRTKPTPSPASAKTAATALTPTVSAPETPATAQATLPVAPQPVANPPAVKGVTTPKAKAPAKPIVKAAARPAANTTPKPADKARKPKLVRDSFTIPKSEYAVIDELKQRGTKLAKPAKKSELLRAGIMLLAALDDAGFKAALAKVPAIKTGRPKKG